MCWGMLGHGMYQDVDKGCVRAWPQDEMRCRAGPDPAATHHGQESQPSPWPPQSRRQAGAAGGLEQPQAQPCDLQDAQEAAASHLLLHAAPSPQGQ